MLGGGGKGVGVQCTQYLLPKLHLFSSPFQPDMCSQHSAAQLKELFDRATEVKAEVFSVPRKQQCNAAFFVM